MPLPWKKHTISRFLADFRSPAKFDGSLTADASFPAALVDLFVKNRDRLLKSAEKHNPCRWIEPSQSPPPPTEAPAVPMRPNKRRFEVIDELSAKSVIVVVVKTFAVVALALSTKSLAIGLTLSAILLLLLEFVGKVDLGLLKPLTNAIQSFSGSIQRRVQFFYSKKAVKRLEKCGRLASPEIDECYESLGTEFEKIEPDRVCFAEKSDEDGSEDSILYGSKCSRRHRIRTKIMKKLHGLKRNKKEEEEISEDCIENEVGLQSNESNVGSRASWSCESSAQVGLEVGGRGRKVDSGFLMLILIVLVGLVDGRIWAFVLTLVWCFIMQLVGNRFVYKKVQRIKSLVSMGR